MRRIPCPLRTDPRVRALIESAELKGRRYFRNAQPILLCKEIQELYPGADAHTVTRAVREILKRPVKKQLNPTKRSKIDSKPLEAAGDKTDKPDKQNASGASPSTKTRELDRYEVLRTHSRGTGRCSWRVWDQKAHTTIYVGDNLKDCLEHIDDLVEADKGFKVVRYGKVTTVTND
jgi:hypothetical protein